MLDLSKELAHGPYLLYAIGDSDLANVLRQDYKVVPNTAGIADIQMLGLAHRTCVVDLRDLTDVVPDDGEQLTVASRSRFMHTRISVIRRCVHKGYLGNVVVLTPVPRSTLPSVLAYCTAAVAAGDVETQHPRGVLYKGVRRTRRRVRWQSQESLARPVQKLWKCFHLLQLAGAGSRAKAVARQSTGLRRTSTRPTLSCNSG